MEGERLLREKEPKQWTKEESCSCVPSPWRKYWPRDQAASLRYENDHLLKHDVEASINPGDKQGAEKLAQLLRFCSVLPKKVGEQTVVRYLHAYIHTYTILHHQYICKQTVPQPNTRTIFMQFLNIYAICQIASLSYACAHTWSRASSAAPRERSIRATSVLPRKQATWREVHPVWICQ